MTADDGRSGGFLLLAQPLLRLVLFRRSSPGSLPENDDDAPSFPTDGMKGIAPHTEAIIEQVSRLECLEGWTLVGGTALAIQLDHRKSEDLDFMRWQKQKGERMDVD
ncbi:nucleotidyl transferase AbiEii/AbiGii toxin family protein [Bacteroides acidifaciens]|uniref:nucleotidyl transferase AbiEii/AbiGii toxin family protein n=1 Tax=Bacteroides acidifaciens TaxID=85831 RepID=UPI00259A01BB|nr:nucleotidyl transferase AbiEii/AbiGii toxin family protein [Bacteroides acidifaciens]